MFARPDEISEEQTIDRRLAKCNDGASTLVGLFFSDQIQDIARAKAICATCPVREPCFQGALERREPWGVWGGHLFLNGKVLAHKRPRGRPPKNAQPLSA
jgi:WhiB family redox-sensing transcriptional regulator